MDRNSEPMSGFSLPNVALRKESVDRNLIDEIQLEFNSVALRKESVDRNILGFGFFIFQRVALRKESVDRNALSALGGTTMPESLSARRAWIEMHMDNPEKVQYSGRSPQGERG